VSADAAGIRVLIETSITGISGAEIPPGHGSHVDDSTGEANVGVGSCDCMACKRSGCVTLRNQFVFLLITPACTSLKILS
jgi:hypothetical protein